MRLSVAWGTKNYKSMTCAAIVDLGSLATGLLRNLTIIATALIPGVTLADQFDPCLVEVTWTDSHRKLDLMACTSQHPGEEGLQRDVLEKWRLTALSTTPLIGNGMQDHANDPARREIR